MPTVSLMKKGGEVKVVKGTWATARVQIDASLKQRISGMKANAEFKGRVEQAAGAGKKDQQGTLKLVEILG